MFDDLYQELILDHYKNPRNKQDLSRSESPLVENPTCGDAVRVKIHWNSEQRIDSVQFDGWGCAISTASASMMTQILEGRNREEAIAICRSFSAQMRGEEDSRLENWGDLIALEGVMKFPARIKCATLSWHAVEKLLIEN